MMMKRLLVFSLIFSLGSSPFAFAGDTVVAAAERAAKHLGRMQASSTSGQQPPVVSPRSRSRSMKAAYAQEPAAGRRGLSGRRKLVFGLAGAAGLAAIMLTIDGKVEDNTPSTKGERTTKPF